MRATNASSSPACSMRSSSATIRWRARTAVTARTRLPVPATSTVCRCRRTLRTSGSPVSSPSSIGADGRNRSRCSASTRDTIPAGVSRAHEAARVDQRDAVGQALGLLHEVGHQDDRHAAGPDVLDELPRVAPGLRVEAGRELVEDRDLRVADERERDREPLLLAARELPEGGPALVGEPEIVQQPLRIAGLRVERTRRGPSLPGRGSGRAARSPGAARRRRDGAASRSRRGSSPRTRIVPESGFAAR